MTLNKTFRFEPSSAVTAGIYASITQNAIFTLDTNAGKAALSIQMGNMSATGELFCELYGGLESAVSAAWGSLASATLTGSSTAALAVASSSMPLFPYAKVSIVAKGGSATTVFENIVAKLVTD